MIVLESEYDVMAVSESATAVNQAGSDREYLSVTNPISGNSIGKIPITTPEAVRAAFLRAKAAQPAWDARGTQARSKLILAWVDLLWEKQKDIIQTIRDEMGKTETSAFMEVGVIYNTTLYYLHHAPHLLRPQTRRSGVPVKHKARLYYKPYGVCGFITPWNYPLLNAWQDLIPALIAGNTALLKPSELTPFTSLRVVDMMYQAGIPQDVVQVLTGDGRTGAAVVEQADYIAFTGSTQTGRRIAMRAAERLIPVSLELGGKDPMIILKDANVDLAASGALAGALENSGQVCVSIERIYVERDIYDPFIERIQHYVQQMQIGAGDGMDVHMGSMTSERELLRSEEHIADALAKGARVLFGGKRRPDLGPLFFEPTILVDVDHTMRVMQEETFGPLVPIMRVDNVQEAVRLANDSAYGLSAAIHSKDLKRAEQIATQIESGDVHINTTHWIFGTTALPMGGVKHSGMGRRNGPEGLMRFVRPQAILVDNQLLDRPKMVLLDNFTYRVVRMLLWLRRRFPRIFL
jgi:acyl-CoA reductase-like NAD-dependent aldehyde dehydrogenase